jgi:hypothetical protein
MLFRLLLLLAFAACSQGSVIDSGAIFNKNTFGMGDADIWTGTMASSSGNYSVQFQTDGAASVICPVPCDPFFLPSEGSVASITANTIADYGFAGSAIVNGIVYPNVFFKGTTADGTFFSSSIRLVSSPFVISPGPHAVPFTMTGFLNVSAGDGLILNESISGSGTLMFALQPTAGPGSALNFAPIFPNNHQFRWGFEPVPEPATLLTVGGAMILLLVSRHRVIKRH